MNKAMELNSYIVEPKIRPFGKSTVPFFRAPSLIRWYRLVSKKF